MEENQNQGRTDFKQEAQNLFKDNGPDDLHIGLKIASFCFPIVGAILYFVKKDNEPKAAKQACNLALIGFGVGLIINIIYYVVAGASAFAQ